MIITTRRLGRSNLQVSALGLGCWAIGGAMAAGDQQLGYAGVDDDLAVQALHASRRRLGRDRIDLYQLHTPEIDDDRAAELVDTLEGLATEGLIGWYGISTDDPTRADIFAAGPRCTAVQLQLNVLDDNPDMLAVCDRHDLAALCRSPLAMGLLGGQYTATSQLPTDDIRHRQPNWLRWFTDGRPTPDFLHRLEAIRHILTSGGRTPGQGALGWIWAHHPRTIPLPGFRNPVQVTENAAALNYGPLSGSEHDDIETILGRLPAYG
jgi:aryl-alcohol dehydrogenase-like predicted oxidoreductase